MNKSLTNADIHHAKGFALRKEGNFRDAVVEYTTAINLDKNHFKAYFNRGFARDKLCLFQEGETGGRGERRRSQSEERSDEHYDPL